MAWSGIRAVGRGGGQGEHDDEAFNGTEDDVDG